MPSQGHLDVDGLVICALLGYLARAAKCMAHSRLDCWLADNIIGPDQYHSELSFLCWDHLSVIEAERPTADGRLESPRHFMVHLCCVGGRNLVLSFSASSASCALEW